MRAGSWAWTMRTMSGIYVMSAGKPDKQVLRRPQRVAVARFRVLEGDLRQWPESEQSTSHTVDGLGS